MRLGPLECPPPGIYYDVPFETYQQWDAVNWSLLRLCDQPMAKVKSEILGERRRETDAMARGTLGHAMLFEPDAVSKRYAVCPADYPVLSKGDGISGTLVDAGVSVTLSQGRGDAKAVNEARPYHDGETWLYEVLRGEDVFSFETRPWRSNAKYCAAWETAQESVGKIVVKQDVYDLALARCLAIRGLPDVHRALAACKSEVSLVWTDTETELTCKGRMDAITLAGRMILDAKLIKGRLDWKRFCWTALREGYLGQCAMYLWGLSEALPSEDDGHFVFIMAEEDRPHLAAAYDFRDNPQGGSFPLVQHGRVLVRRGLVAIKAALDDDNWPGHNPGPGGVGQIMEMEVPEEMANRLEGGWSE